MIFSSNIHKKTQYFYSKSNADRTPHQEMVAYFEAIAEQVIAQIDPESVLVFGGMSQYLVSALRERDVQAFGALEPGRTLDEVSEEVKLFYGDGTLSSPALRTYDLIVCLEIFPLFSIDEAEKVCERLCSLTSDILFSATPFELKGREELNIQPPDYWADIFANRDYFRDVNFYGGFVSPWAFRYRKVAVSSQAMSAVYQQRIWELEQEVEARRSHQIEQRKELVLKEMQLVQVQQQFAFKVEENEAILQSRSWQIMRKFQNIRLRIMPIGSRSEKWVLSVVSWFRLWRREGTRSFILRVFDSISSKVKVVTLRYQIGGRFSNPLARINAVPPKPAITPRTAKIDVVICVHNALEDVQCCLNSVIQYSRKPYSLIVVDDGSDSTTQQFLIDFASEHGVTLIRNEQAGGYTRAANQGMKAARGDLVVLLNSDTIVTAGWLEQMTTCAESDTKIGIVGPLSNTASWQSIPEIESNGDWATNALPFGITTEKMAALVDKYSGYLFPRLPFLNGFCLLIRREVINQIGYFDEESFGQGYGEENDYCLRTRKAGWTLAIADQAYIYHAQSKSYSSERRRQLAEQASRTLAKKYGQRIIDQGVEICRWSPVLEGIRARTRFMFQREDLIKHGERNFAGKRVLFILPIEAPSGGGNVVLTEGRAMQAMGVEVVILNLRSHQQRFSEAYPDSGLPVIYVDIDEINKLTKDYDAVIATFNPSVGWMAPGSQTQNRTIFGYYIQDFEPYFYPVESDGYIRAWESYSLIPDLRRMTKTDWTRQELRNQIGLKSQVVGPSFDVDLFRPRPRTDPDWPDRPLRIAAMVRTSSSYRAPRETMETLRQASRHFGRGIEIILFGSQLEDPDFSALPRDFVWSLAGMLDQRKMANLLNEVDIFVDFSTYQAMGMTALEAMACGAAVIVPMRGGITEIAKDQENSLIVDTSSEQARWEALKRLIEDPDLRRHLQRAALREVCQYYPEGPAFRILSTLFGEGG